MRRKKILIVLLTLILSINFSNALVIPGTSIEIDDLDDLKLPENDNVYYLDAENRYGPYLRDENDKVNCQLSYDNVGNLYYDDIDNLGDYEEQVKNTWNIAYYIETSENNFELLNELKLGETQNPVLTEAVKYNIGEERLIAGGSKNIDYDYDYDLKVPSYGGSFRIVVVYKEPNKDLIKQDSATNYEILGVLDNNGLNYQLADGNNTLKLKVKVNSFAYRHDQATDQTLDIRYTYDFEVSKDNIPFDYDKTKVKISSAKDFIDLANNCKDYSYSIDKRVVLLNDIDLSAYDASDYIVPSFSGYFDGTYHKIKGINLDISGSNIALFRYVEEDGKINNLLVEGTSKPTGTSEKVALLVSENNGLISDCEAYGEVEGTSVVAGICALNNSDSGIEDCRNYANVVGISQVGGITGENKGTIIKSKNYGGINNVDRDVSENVHIMFNGGISGYNIGLIKNCDNYGKIGYENITDFSGGISGVNLADIVASTNNEKVFGIGNVGGISGVMGQITEKVNDETIDFLINIYTTLYGKEVEKDDVELDINENGQANIDYCANFGDIQGDNNVGGITGQVVAKANALISNTYNYGKVTGLSNNIGGIAGFMECPSSDNTITAITDTYSYATIDAEAASYVGGIVGHAVSGQVKFSMSYGIIKGDSFVGGICGYSDILTDCIANNIIKATGESVGGICGNCNNKKDIQNNYFVNNGFGGIDNINYLAYAKEITASDLVSKDTLPYKLTLDKKHYTTSKVDLSYPQLKAFTEESDLCSEDYIKDMQNASMYAFVITFVDDEDNIIGEIRVNHGASISDDQIPKIPSKEDYYAYYDDFDKENINENLIVKANYIHTVSSIADASRTIFLEGTFEDDVTVKLQEESGEYISKYEGYNIIKSYTYDIYKAGEKKAYDNLTIKLKAPETTEKLKVAIKTDEGIKIVSSELSHEYLVFDSNSNNNHILILSTNTPWYANFRNILAISAFVILLLFVGGLRTRRRIKREQKRRDAMTKRSRLIYISDIDKIEINSFFDVMFVKGETESVEVKYLKQEENDFEIKLLKDNLILNCLNSDRPDNYETIITVNEISFLKIIGNSTIQSKEFSVDKLKIIAKDNAKVELEELRCNKIDSLLSENASLTLGEAVKEIDHKGTGNSQLNYSKRSKTHFDLSDNATAIGDEVK